ncbi:glycosyltransferase family 4 protein [Photobacterium chitinilyticum]|uniref:glycosyltransferase family 4 protein n=1 Tax=Photobacterium chitinilyticum TaxID=2485123 RepID=UPI003D137A0C
MKIINVNQSSRVVGGSDIYWKSLTELLRSNGNEVFEFHPSVESDAVFPKELDFNNPKLLDFFKYCYNYEAEKKLNKFVEMHNPQLAHLHIYYGKLTASILKPFQQRDIPVVQTLHEYKIVCPTYKMYRDNKVCYACSNNNFYKAALYKCNRNSIPRSILTSLESYVSLIKGSQSMIQQYISVSDYQRNELIKMGIDGNKVKTVHNFIEDSLFFPEYNDGEYFLYFGRVEKEKGIDVIIDTAERTKKHGAKFLVVGDGNYLKEALSIVNTRNIDNIKFHGPTSRNNISTLINKSIAVLAPSLWSETFGLVLLEAFACSKPVIASDIGGMTEIITDGTDGFLVSPGSVDELVDKVIFLSSNVKVAKEMGASGLIKQKTLFSKKAHYEKIKSIYRELLGE